MDVLGIICLFVGWWIPGLLVTIYILTSHSDSFWAISYAFVGILFGVLTCILSKSIWIYFLFLGGDAICVICFIMWRKQKAKEKTEKEERERQRLVKEHLYKIQKLDEFNKSGKEGKWQFPTEKFYQDCNEIKVDDVSGEYGYNKAKSIAEQLIRGACPEADMLCFQAYLTKEKLQEFLDAGKPQAELTAKRELAKKKQVRFAKAYPYEATFIKRATAVSNLTGNEKRVKTLTDLLNDCDDRIQKLKDGEEAMKQLAMVYAGAQKKESDWAILGGAANGIGGPVASAAVIWDTMKRNGEIAKYNEGMRKASAEALSGTLTVAGDRYKVEKERENVKQRLDEAKGKVSLSKPDTKEIFESFRVDTQYGKVTKNDSGILKCALDIQLKKPLVLDVPEGLNMVVDGTIRAKVMMEDIYVGAVVFPLPIYGIPCDMTKSVTLDGMCEWSMEYDGKYTLELAEEQNLWVMEA